MISVLMASSYLLYILCWVTYAKAALFLTRCLHVNTTPTAGYLVSAERPQQINSTEAFWWRTKALHKTGTSRHQVVSGV